MDYSVVAVTSVGQEADVYKFTNKMQMQCKPQALKPRCKNYKSIHHRLF